MSRTVVRSLFPVFPASLRRRARPSLLRLTGPRQLMAGALGAAPIALTVVAAVTLGVPASPAWASTQTVNCTSGTFTVTDNVVINGSTCKGTATIPPGATSIGAGAFAFVFDSSQPDEIPGLLSVVIPQSVTSIGVSAFRFSQNLTSVAFEANSSLQTIGNMAFNTTGLTSIHIPKSVTSIGELALQNIPALQSVTFEENSMLNTIGISAFADNRGLQSIEIPKSVTSISNFAFVQNAALASVTFEAGSKLQEIGLGAFAFTGLTTIAIPELVTLIGGSAFLNSSFLASVTFEGNEPPTLVAANAFAGVADGATANISFVATGFEPVVSGLWKGLFLVRAAASSAPVGAASDPVGPALACMPEGPPAVGALVTCTVTGGDAGIEILWRAAYNPVFAGEGMTLDASGAGTFSFVVPAAAFGQPITVELVDWTAPVSLGVSGGPVPTSVPAGGGPVPVWTLALAALAGVGLLRRGMRAQA